MDSRPKTQNLGYIVEGTYKVFGRDQRQVVIQDKELIETVTAYKVELTVWPFGGPPTLSELA